MGADVGRSSCEFGQQNRFPPGKIGFSLTEIVFDVSCSIGWSYGNHKGRNHFSQRIVCGQIEKLLARRRAFGFPKLPLLAGRVYEIHTTGCVIECNFGRQIMLANSSKWVNQLPL